MKRRWLALTAALAALAALLAVAVLEPGLEQPGAGLGLTALDPASVDRIVISRTGEDPIELALERGRWQLVSPIRARANPVRAGAIASLAGASSNLHYRTGDVDLERLGLAPARVELQLGDVRLRIGAREELDGLRYVQNGDTVFLLQDRFFHHLTSPVPGYVDPALVPTGAQIRKLETERFTVSLEGGRWAWSPSATFTSADASATLISRWHAASAMRVGTMDYTLEWRETLHLTIGDSPPTRLLIARTPGKLLLGDPALDLQYELPAARGEALLAPDT